MRADESSFHESMSNDIEKQNSEETNHVNTRIDTNKQNTQTQHDSINTGYMYQIDSERMDHSHSDSLGTNALTAYKLSKGLKYTSITAFFLNLSLILFNQYYVFFVLCAMWCYYASLQYKPWVVLSVFVYFITNMIVRFSIMTYDSVNSFNNEIFKCFSCTAAKFFSALVKDLDCS